MSFVDDWDEHSIIYSAGIDEGSRNDEQLQTQALLASSLPTQVNQTTHFLHKAQCSSPIACTGRIPGGRSRLARP